MAKDPDATRTVTIPSGEPQAVKLPRVGDVVDSKYRVDSVLGQGGMGVVVSVTHLQLNELYAMKFLHPEAASNTEALARFMREARAAVRIKSEHVAHVTDVGQLPNGCPYIVMEHLAGVDLSDRLREGGPFEIEEAVEYVLQACVGVAEAHARGIVHRDLKPSNLFLTRRLDGTALIKVLDFGISKASGETTPELAEITKSHSVFGSPAYMSPEQLKSAKSADVRSDVWSLGVILYKLLCGEAPFESDTYAGVISAVLGDPPHSLRARRSEVPAELEAVIWKCLAKDPAQRFQNVADLAVALRPFAGANSHVSVGRIVRLGSITESSASASALERMRTVDKRNSHSPTHQPWESSAELRPPRKRARTAAFAAFGVIAVGVGVWVGSYRPGPLARPQTPAAQAPSAAPSGEVERPTATPSSAPTVPSSVPTPEAPSATPSAVAASSVAVREEKPPVGKKPPLVKGGKQRTMTPTPTRLAPSASVAPTPPPTGAPKIDPTAESH